MLELTTFSHKDMGILMESYIEEVYGIDGAAFEKLVCVIGDDQLDYGLRTECELTRKVFENSFGG